MKILVLTFYYPPDLSAGSYRAKALVDALVRAGSGALEIDVLTTCPHRYASYRYVTTLPGISSEPERSVTVNRVPVTLHRSGLMDQSVAFSGFAARALRAVRGRRYDVVVATSSRLLTGFLGSVVAGRTGARLYLDIRDLFIDNVRDMFRSKPGVPFLMPLLSLMERKALRRAGRINLVSAGFLGYYEETFAGHEYRLFGNGIDREFLEYDFLKPSASDPRTVLYAGNIGLGQGLEKVVPEAAPRLGPAYHLRIIGDGGQRIVLEQRLRAAGVGNVTVIPPMDRASLKLEYRQADYLLLHLNGFPALENVVPSKIFEYAATGKPILAGVRGYTREFIATHVEGAATFEPGDAEGLVSALRSLTPGHNERGLFRERFSRERIMNEMAADILGLTSMVKRSAGVHAVQE